MKAKLSVLGDFNIDLVRYLDRLPNPGETLTVNDCFEGPGGKGSDQAIATARLGAEQFGSPMPIRPFLYRKLARSAEC